jgi:hypothetical protein
MTSDQAEWPISIRRVCSRLKIPVVRSNSVHGGKAYLSWNLHSSDLPKVLLPETNLSVWDRFCIAHELGHFVLISRYRWLPTEEDGYWKTERLCDQFARDLLMPQNLLASACATTLEDGQSAMMKSRELAMRAVVPWIQSGKALSDVHPGVAFLRLQGIGGKGGFRVTGSSLPKDRGRHRKIPLAVEAGQVLSSLLADSHDAFVPIQRRIARNVFSGTTVGELMSELRVVDVFARASSRHNYVELALLRASGRAVVASNQ